MKLVTQLELIRSFYFQWNSEAQKTMSSSNLRFKEVERLVKILDSKHQIHGKGNFPVIEVEPRTLIQVSKTTSFTIHVFSFINQLYNPFTISLSTYVIWRNWITKLPEQMKIVKTTLYLTMIVSEHVGIFNSMIFNYSEELKHDDLFDYILSRSCFIPITIFFLSYSLCHASPWPVRKKGTDKVQNMF